MNANKKKTKKQYTGNIMLGNTGPAGMFLELDLIDTNSTRISNNTIVNTTSATTGAALQIADAAGYAGTNRPAINFNVFDNPACLYELKSSIKSKNVAINAGLVFVAVLFIHIFHV